MASARPSAFKKGGGGFLNNVDGVIQDYEFTTEFDGGNGQKPRKPKGDFTTLWARLTVLQDGADEPVSTHLFAGNADLFEIEDDGKTLVAVEEGTELWASAEWSQFIASMVESGLPETDLPDDSINYEAILGKRVRFVRVNDESEYAKTHKRKDKKTGKEYPLQVLTVTQVYDDAPKKGAKTTAATTKRTVAAGGKANGKAKEVDLTEIADETIGAILDANDGEVMKSKLPVLIAKQLGVKHPQREEVRKLIYSDDYLTDAAERGILNYDVSDKKQMISAA